MKTIQPKLPFCKSVSRWATFPAFGIFLAACVWLVPTVLAQSTDEPYTFTTLAGNAGYGSVDGTGSDARFWYPIGVAVDSSGNVYVAEQGNNTIRKVTPEGVVTTLAGRAGYRGSADGTGSAARFNEPRGVAVDSAGNIYVADTSNSTILKVTPAGEVTTLAGLAGSSGSADGTGSAAQFSGTFCVAVDSMGNVYMADRYPNHTIRKVTQAGVVTTLAGLAGSWGSADGTGSDARFSDPQSVAVDSAGNVYVADTGNGTIRKVTPAGVVTTLAGLAGRAGSVNGTGSAARFTFPSSVAVDSAGNVYVAEHNNHTIRKVTPAGVTTPLAGRAGSFGSTDGTGSAARFNQPVGVAVDNAGNVYVADTFNHTIRKVTPTAVVTTLAGLAISIGSVDGTGTGARFGNQAFVGTGPTGVAVDSAGNVYVADNGTIRKVTLAGEVTTLAGLPGGWGTANGSGNGARFGFLHGVAVDSAGNVYVADSNNTLRKVTPAGVVTTLAGLAGSFDSADGMGSAARFYAPKGAAVDSAGNVYVADQGNNTIRKVTPEGVVTTLAGRAGYSGSADGTGSVARFNSPSGLAVDSAGNVYVADAGSRTIRKVTPVGEVTTLARLAGSFGFGAYGTDIGSVLSGVAVDSTGNIYVADVGNNTILKLTPAGAVTTLAGLTGDYGYGSADGTGNAARFYYPQGISVDSEGNVYVADTFNHTIRKGYPALRILTTVSGFGFNGGQLGFNLTGPAGQLVVVQASADLVSWLPIWTNTVTDALNFSDPQSGVFSNRFYRAHLP